MDESKIPILVGCGQITQREEDPEIAQSPMDLTASAARAAASDTGVGNRLLAELDTILVTRSFSDSSWRFASPFGHLSNPPKSLAERICAQKAKRLIYTHSGGNMVQWSVNRFFEMMTRGDADLVLIAGGESLATQKSAQRSGIRLNWGEDPGGNPEMWGVDKPGWNEVEERHGMSGAIFAYPLFETAIRGFHKRSIKEHGTIMGNLFAAFASIAAKNPLADRRQGFSAEEISKPGPSNPYIGYPYTKLMNANAFIDQSAALILTTVAKAKTFGIPKDKWVYLHGCADAYDHWYISDRKNFYSSPAMRAVGKETFEMADVSLNQIGAFDIYSCFPSAVQIACQEMGIPINDPRGLTVTGGLPYFGGPGNNYVTHSIAEMMKRVRSKPGMKGLVTSNGNYMTKQSAGIYSTEEPNKPFAPKDPKIYQSTINEDKGRIAVVNPNGRATIETYAVIHDKAGPSFAILFCLQEDGSRFIANTPDDSGLLADMVNEEYLNARGRVANNNGLNIFTPD